MRLRAVQADVIRLVILGRHPSGGADVPRVAWSSTDQLIERMPRRHASAVRRAIAALVQRGLLVPWSIDHEGLPIPRGPWFTLSTNAARIFDVEIVEQGDCERPCWRPIRDQSGRRRRQPSAHIGRRQLARALDEDRSTPDCTINTLWPAWLDALTPAQPKRAEAPPPPEEPEIIKLARALAEGLGGRFMRARPRKADVSGVIANVA